MSSKFVAGVASLAVVSAILVGCGTPAKEKGNNAMDAKDSPAAETTGGKPDGAAPHDDKESALAEARAELAKLPPDDAASAEKQRVCPVSDELLGSMGAPIKVDVSGRQVWICCEGCKDSLLEKPDEYLAKLPKD